MPRGVTCIPKWLKEILLKDLDSAVPRLNEEGLAELEDALSSKMPSRVKSTIKLTEYIRSLPECV